MKKTPRMLMRLSLSHFIILLILGLPCSIKAQNAITYPVDQNWKMIFESPTHYEVSVRVIKCNPDTPAQVQVELFNEGTGIQTARFKLTISNSATNETVVKEISHSMPLGALIMASCDNNEQSLRINLPSGWNLSTVQSTLTYMP